MKMKDTQHTYWDLLARYFGGNASEAEQAWIQQQKEQDPSFAKVYSQVRRLYSKPAADANGYEPDVEMGWKRLQTRVKMRQLSDPPVMTPAPKRNSYGWAVAASIVFLLTAGLWLAGRLNENTEWVEVQTALNETKELLLADGSRVMLNENSRLAYPQNFDNDGRTVRLNGEAFFEVQKAEGKRFTVLTEGTKTEVIGTAFYLRAYPSEEVRIQVREGKVAFANLQNQEAVFLTPGQEAIMPAGQPVPRKKEIEDPNFQAWQSKQLQFSDTRLDRLVKTIEAYFDTSISIRNPDLHNCRFTVSFEQPELEEVLEILAITGNLTIKKESDNYVISGESCK